MQKRILGKILILLTHKGIHTVEVNSNVIFCSENVMQEYRMQMYKEYAVSIFLPGFDTSTNPLKVAILLAKLAKMEWKKTVIIKNEHVSLVQQMEILSCNRFMPAIDR